MFEMGLLAFFFLIHTALASPELRVEGRHFIDSSGRTVLLRGVNLSGLSKSSPFLPFGSTDYSVLDPLATWGMNVVRLVFIWAAYEPEKDKFNDAYLDHVTEVADAAWARGLYTIIDLHQDSFSRYVGPHCGCGFPAWASHSDPDPGPPRNCGTLWGPKMAFSLEMHRAFKNFYADKYGARTELMAVWRRLGRHFRDHPGVIGYDLLNEPWGKESSELSAYYEDAARAVRSEDPTSILFIEPHALSAVGFKGKTRLRRPTFSNFAFAPHFYDPWAAVTQNYFLWNPFIGLFFRRLPKQAARWNVPLFVGEFGAYANTSNVARYVERQYDLLDSSLASGAQWNYTPSWGRVRMDGWNDEDYSIVDEDLSTRRNYALRPYPMKTAGWPVRFTIDHGPFVFRHRPEERPLTERSAARFASATFSWLHVPRLGATELYFPLDVFFDGATPQVRSTDPAMRCSWEHTGTRLVCSSPVAGFKKIVVSKPRPGRSGSK